MPRVLILARYFPPIGGAGVHRTVGSVRHLADHGYDPVVVTGPGQQRGRWDAHDLELLDRIPSEVQVHRVAGPEPEGPTGMAARVARAGGRREAWVRWWVEESVQLALRVAPDADVVVTSCAPYDTAIAGMRIARELGRPWVADLEDPWALDEMRMHPTALHQALDVRRMRRALSSASAVVMAAPEAATRLRGAMPELAQRPVAGIPIGFEPDDFVGEASPRIPGVFRIVHTGSMHTDLGEDVRRTRRRRRVLGGTLPGLDVLTRSHVFLVEAIESMLAADPALRGRIELVLAGALGPADSAVAARHDFVKVRGLLSHRETAGLMRSADLLFLPMHDLPEGTRAGLIPYKTYEYLGARRPILAAVPDGDVRDMLAPLGSATLVRPADVDGMAAALSARLRAWDAGDDGEADENAVRALERGECVAQIAAVLDDVLSRSGSVPEPVVA
jgi:glycosyltransferase involved in cell wall biosynthesis